MDHIFYFDRNLERLEELTKKIKFAALRKCSIETISEGKILYQKINGKKNALLYYISSDLTNVDIARLNKLRALIQDLRIALISDEKHALMAWKLSLFDFKPIPADIRDFLEVYGRYVQTVEGYKDYIPIKTKEGNFKLPFKSINYLKADGSYTFIYTNDHNRPFHFSRPIKEFEKYIVYSSYLKRLHKGYIFNLANIKLISDNEIQFYGKKSNSVIGVSRELGRRIRKEVFKK